MRPTALPQRRPTRALLIATLAGALMFTAGCNPASLLGVGEIDPHCAVAERAATGTTDDFVPSVITQAPPMPDLPIDGVGRLVAERNGDHSADPYPLFTLRAPGVLFVQRSSDDLKGLDEKSKKALKRAKATITLDEFIEVSGQSLVRGTIWKLGTVEGHSGVYACDGSNMLVTAIEVRPDKVTPCDRLAIQARCTKLYDATASALAQSTQMLMGPGNGSQPEYEDSKLPQFEVRGQSVTLTMQGGFFTSESFAADLVRDGFVEAGWQQVSAKCRDFIFCSRELPELPYTATFSQQDMTARVQVRAVEDNPYATVVVQ